MIVAAMQPYFFPYIGYFQLIQAADIFVFLDDVQYIERGWVNRNRVRNNNSWMWLTRAVEKAPRELPITQRRYIDSGPNCASDICQRLKTIYRKAPANAECLPIITSLLSSPECSVAHFNRLHTESLARTLGIETPCIAASEASPRGPLKGQDRIIDLCHRLGATHYINPIGGITLYSKEIFEREGIQLNFIRTQAPLVQLQPEPSHLSIIDHLMHNGINETIRRMPDYELLRP